MSIESQTLFYKIMNYMVKHRTNGQIYTMNIRYAIKSTKSIINWFILTRILKPRLMCWNRDISREGSSAKIYYKNEKPRRRKKSNRMTSSDGRWRKRVSRLSTCHGLTNDETPSKNQLTSPCMLTAAAGTLSHAG